MYQGGFNLRKWKSELLKLNDHTECEPSLSTSTSHKCASKSSTSERDPCKLLGVNWDSSRDELTFEFSGLIQDANELPKTKRSVLKGTKMLK